MFGILIFGYWNLFGAWNLVIGGLTREDNIKKRGFTLIEVLVTTAVLSLGIVLIYRGFFTLLDSYGYYSNYLRVAAFADEKLWQAQDALSCFGPGAGAGSSGRLNIRNKNFNWRLSVSPIEAESLYRIDLAVDWQEGPRIRGLTRNAYALYIKKEE